MLGKLYIIGGSEAMEALFFPFGCTDVDVVSLDTGEAAAAAPMQAPRTAPAVASSTSSIFVFGGWHQGSELASCEIFDAASASESHLKK